jgi:transposase-like protein
MDMALARSKISNRMVAQRLGVDETTIRRWRKENIEFERALPRLAKLSGKNKPRRR